MSVRQNLLYGRWFAPRGERRIDFDAVVETLGITNLVSRSPTRLSGGERQRVAIGRALLSCPRLLLLDEPLAALDMDRKLEILPLIERVRDEFDLPIIYVTHAVEEVVRLASRVVILDAGQVKSVGAPEQALNRLAYEPAANRFDRSSVLSATVEEKTLTHGLTKLKHPAGTIWITGSAGPPGSVARVIVKATDVVLSLVPPQEISARSVVWGKIANIQFEGPIATVAIELKDDGQLLATITRGALEDLVLKVGSQVYALFKTAALDERSIGVASAQSE